MPLLIFLFLFLSFTIQAQPQVNLGADTLICDGVTHTLDARNPGSTYEWSTHQTSQKVDIYLSGEYWVTVTDEHGNKTQDTIEVVFLNEFYRQTDHWIFANGGNVRFKPQPNTSPSKGSFPASTSSISDPLGNLLFYSDGGTIYDRDGNIMLNGENMAGDPAYKANSIIIPMPGSAIYHYVFTLYPDIGLYYSKVDMSGNGGKGEVEEKNVLLDEYAGDFTSVIASDGFNVWMIVHNKYSNVFYSYKIDRYKIGEPVISAGGPILASTKQMKITPYGDKFVITDGQNVHLYKYLPGEGKVQHISSVAIPGAHGAEFSRAGTNLFVTAGNLVYQIDVSPIPQTPSPVLIHEGPAGTYYGDLQLAINGDIYIAENGANCLPVIINSNNNATVESPGHCLELGSTLNSDLPIFPQHYFQLPDGLGLRYQDTCQNYGQIISAAYFLDQYPLAEITYQIDLGDGTVIDTNYTYHTYKDPGTYEITLTVNSVCHTIERKVEVHIDSIPEFTPLPDTAFCRGVAITLDPKVDNIYNPKWSTGETAKSISVSESGSYTMEIVGTYCSARDTANITVWEPPVPELTEWDFLCREKEETLVLEAKDGTEFYWHYSGDTTNKITVASAGLYTVLVTDENGCSIEDTSEIENICEAEVFVPDVFTPNNDYTNDIFLPKGKYVQAYELRIYDRWGELIFTSNDMNIGWDGTYRGREATGGAYGYVIIYESKTRFPKNTVKTAKGHFLLLK